MDFCKGLWSAAENQPLTSLIVSGGASQGDADGRGCIYLSRVLPTSTTTLELRKDHWMSTPGGVTCLGSAATIGNTNQIDLFAVGTDTGNVCVVQVDKYNGQFLKTSNANANANANADANSTLNSTSSSSHVVALERQPSDQPCSITAISVAKQGQEAVAVTDSGGVYFLESMYQHLHSVVKFDVRENSALNDVAHLQESTSFVTAGASPVAQLKIWDPRVSTKDGNAVVAAFKDENSSISYVSVAPHPTDKHLVMTGTSDGYVCVWDIRQGQVKNRAKKHSGAVTGIAFGTPHSQHIYTTSSDGESLHWDFKAHAMHNDTIVSYYDHEASVTKCKVTPLWETPPGVAVCANDVAVPSDGRADLVVVAYDDGALVVSDV